MTLDDLKQDPRLNGMEKEKLDFLTRLVKEAGQTSPNSLLPLLLRAVQNGQQTDFTDQETELIFSILTAELTPAQQKQAETIRMLSRSLVKNQKKTKP